MRLVLSHAYLVNHWDSDMRVKMSIMVVCEHDAL